MLTCVDNSSNRPEQNFSACFGSGRQVLCSCTSPQAFRKNTDLSEKTTTRYFWCKSQENHPQIIPFHPENLNSCGSRDWGPCKRSDEILPSFSRVIIFSGFEFGSSKVWVPWHQPCICWRRTAEDMPWSARNPGKKLELFSPRTWWVAWNMKTTTRKHKYQSKSWEEFVSTTTRNGCTRHQKW